jgi:hypothetical protein
MQGGTRAIGGGQFLRPSMQANHGRRGIMRRAPDTPTNRPKPAVEDISLNTLIV